MPFDTDTEDDWVEDEGGDEDDLLACPTCREPVHEDTQQCPHCREWITPVDPRHQTRRRVFTIVVVLLLISILLWAVR